MDLIDRFLEEPLVVHGDIPAFRARIIIRARRKVYCTNGVKMPRPGIEGLGKRPAIR